MKYFSKLQITVLAVLSVTVVGLAIAAFAMANSLSSEPLTANISTFSTATPEIVYIELADPTPSPDPIPVPTPTLEATDASSSTATPSHNREGDGLFTLDILGDEISIAYGVEESTLEKTPGWLTSSVLPGQDGMCVVYGHRNRNHLKILEKVQRGDAITVTMADGATYTYSITDITIYESTSDLRLPTVDGKTLVLVTCYPFHYSGHAPGKCVVVAQTVGR